MASLYLHIPFCTQRCIYCDFYFTTTRASRAPFLKAMHAELAHYGAEYGLREPVETIYFGGGTPSLLSARALGDLLDEIHRVFRTADVCETTLEMNPDDADLDYLRALRSLGFDRLSIGAQSFYEADLAFLNRSHTPEQAAGAIERAQQAGFDNLSVDLIFGIPDQPEEYWRANVQKLVQLGAPHLSTYGLTIEERTPLRKMVAQGSVTPAPDEEFATRFLFAMDFLREQGYEHYEISSFALPGRRSRHNEGYWRHANYLGFGPSAHSFWWEGRSEAGGGSGVAAAERIGAAGEEAGNGAVRTGTENGSVRKSAAVARRWRNEANLRKYEALAEQRTPPVEEVDVLSRKMLADEYVFLRLRTSDGLDVHRLQRAYGRDILSDKPDLLVSLEQEGYVEWVGKGRLCLTDAGKLVCDSVVQGLVG